MGANHLERGVGAEPVARRVLGLGDPVGQEDHDIAVLERRVLDGREQGPRQHPERRPATLHHRLHGSGAVEVIRRRVAGVHVAQSPGRGIDVREDQRDVAVLVEILVQHLVDLRQHLAWLEARRRQEAEVGPGLGHDERRPETMARHVANHDAERPVRQREVVVVIAAGRQGRERARRDFQAGEGGRGRRVEPPLHVRGVADLELPLLGTHAVRHVLQHRDEVHDPPLGVLDGRDGLLGVAEVAVLLAVDRRAAKHAGRPRASSRGPRSTRATASPSGECAASGRPPRHASSR